ncbi:MAG: LUD domain-containing protein [Acidimicrobiia bacterium]
MSTGGTAATQGSGQDQISASLLEFQRAWRGDRGTRIAELDEVGGFEHLRHGLSDAKKQVRARWSEYIDAFTANAEAAGSTVVMASNAEEANQYIVDLCLDKGADLVVKGKSMATEEIGLNDALERAGIVALETDLGEWLVQLANDQPSHLVMPAIHMRRQEVAALLERELGRPFDPDDIKAMVRAARTEMRADFSRAKVGLTGANVLIAERGTVMIVCNEGNNRMSVALPDTHIVVAGIEKLVRSFGDAMNVVRLLPRSATGQVITTYTNFITGPRPGQEQHIVLIDNGRSAMAERKEFADALACIRCGACANVCPSFQAAGGHRFGHIYTGPIGIVVTPFHHGLEAAAGPQELCVSCGACTTVCPADIPLAQQILRVRADVREQTPGGFVRRTLLRMFSRRWIVAVGIRFAAILTSPFRKGQTLRLPMRTRQTTWRSLPAIPVTPARSRLAASQTHAPDRPTVGVLLQCVSDRVAPDIAVSAVHVLEAAGYNVEIPKSQHCCGLPAYDSGEWEIARRMARDTLRTFQRFDTIVTPAPSCVVAMAHEYATLLKDDETWLPIALEVGPKVHDLVSFLADQESLVGGTVDDHEPVTVHRFCQSGNVLGHTDEIDRVLAAAGIEVIQQAEPDVCCGFGGSASVTAPDVSSVIAARKLDSLQAAGVSTIVADNPGCILHLRGVIDAAGVEMDVVHPGEILARRGDRS